jgi:peptide/nickel transport system permease protein
MPLAVADAILLEAGLSFLGLGVQPPEPSWGLLLGTARNFMDQSGWYDVFPGVMLVLVILALNTLADTVQKHLDPFRGRR